MDGNTMMYLYNPHFCKTPKSFLRRYLPSATGDGIAARPRGFHEDRCAGARDLTSGD